MPRTLSIVGASARAAAMSARVAGFEVWAADLFADSDLRALGPVEQVAEYPHGLLRALQSSPSGPWMYTGAIENYPDLIDDLAAVRPLYGNTSKIVRRVRDPLAWSAALMAAGFSAPTSTLDAVECATNGRWLIKPLRSSGGHRVRVWDQHAAQQHERLGLSDRQDYFFQERIAGQSISAVFVASEGQAVLLGVTRQLSADDSTLGSQHAALDSFRYIGSIGPMLLDETVYVRLQQIGGLLSREFKLIGLFGVDAMLSSDDVWPVEINPRYTASIEVLERASALRTFDRRSRRLLAIEWHEAACCFRTLPDPISQSTAACVGKLIVYADRAMTFGDAAARWAIAHSLGQTRPSVADIPLAGTAISVGQPILTLLADGEDESQVMAELRRLKTQVHGLLKM